MYKTKYQIRKEKELTNSYCRENPMREIISVLRSDNESGLWNKIKSSWTIEDWRGFFKLKIDNYGSNI